MCSAKIGVPKKPWKAELPCGEKVLLTEEETVGEGSKCLDDGGCNCGFLAFGKSRDDVADCLTFEMLNDASRQVMASEIRQGLQGLSGLESGVQAPFHERIKQGVNDDCITEAEVEKYVAALRGGRLWLGHQGALLYAMHNRISLYIWEKNSSNCLELKLVNHHHCESRSKVIHMLSTGTHLNRLSCSPDLAVDEHKAAHAMIKKTSWNRGKIMIIAATVAFTLLSIIFGYSIQLHEERDQTPSNLFPKISQAGTALCKELHSFPEKETICLQKLEQEEAMVRAFVQTMTEGAVAVTARTESWPPLYVAIYRGNLEMVKVLVKRDKTAINHRDRLGNNALLLATLYGRTQIFEWLISKEASELGLDKSELSLETRSSEGWTAFLTAAYAGNLGFVKHLVAKYPERDFLTESDRHGRNAAQIAQYYAHDAVFDYLSSLNKQRAQNTLKSRG